MIITRAPFRVSFCGGGSDLPSFYEKYGGCVLSTTIRKYMYLTIHNYFEKDQIVLKYSKTEIVHDYSEIEHRIFKQCLSDFGLKGVELSSMADIPAGTGLGSSSTFTVALLQLLNTYTGQYVSKYKLAKDASTSAVYGEMLDVKLTETTGGIKPVSYYGGAKLASEALISSYVSMCDMNVVIFRFPNVIGPRLTHGAVFDFIRKLRKNPHSLEILGNGTQCKPYIYVLDLVEAIVRLTEDFKPGEDIYNISVESEGTTVTHIAEIVVDVLGLSNVKFEYTGGDRGWKGDVPRFSYDISKVLSTGWKPKHTSDEAVRQTVKDAVEAGM